MIIVITIKTYAYTPPKPARCSITDHIKKHTNSKLTKKKKMNILKHKRSPKHVQDIGSNHVHNLYKLNPVSNYHNLLRILKKW